MLNSLFLVVLFAIFFEQLVAEADQNKECPPTRCGNVIIEPPFGIGPNCSRDEYFEVACSGHESSPNNPKPILTKFNFELLQLQSYSVMGNITVNIPVGKICADNSFKKGAKHEVTSWSSLNLSGSPFYISMSNVFASVGCDGFAALYNETGRVIGGCTSSCNPPNSGAAINACYGYRCCQSEIHLQYNTLQTWRLKISVRKAESCRSAFIISDDYLNSNASIVSVIARSQVIPVVLDWDIRRDYGHTAGTTQQRWITLVTYITIGSLTLPFTCCCFWACWYLRTKKRRKETKLRAKYFKKRLEQSSSNREVVRKTKLFTIKELKRATDNFSSDSVIGQGGQGTVYKGMLTNGQVIAVKRPKMFEESQWKQFINEVILLSQVNHKNIVKLLGCCLETKLPLLIYEFITNGTLSQHIHNTANEFLITWDMRVSIASEIAGAIAYLHSSSSTPIYHRDIKSTNILLDDKFQAKVSDFGISKAAPVDKTHLTTCVQGTFGYLDPEYFRSSQFSEKSDVYSFGVILIELLTGQHPIRATTSEEEEKSLVAYFISSMNESTLDKILDPLVLEKCTTEEVVVVANLARRCVSARGAQRPTMKEVAMELERLGTKSSSTTAVVGHISKEIEEAITMPTTLMDNAYTTSAIDDLGNIDLDNCGDEHPLYVATL